MDDWAYKAQDFDTRDQGGVPCIVRFSILKHVVMVRGKSRDLVKYGNNQRSHLVLQIG